ncbi:MarR family winged helix-turn-helix transcriptional regulator [Phenylobacterium sp.]|uniref:MarR family winged helix-turn-helix transcriptional regulator n=1 Tax=Phenylobacterium sp. TaxID=1871053 RepID=UPI0025F0557A|nr:MarR family winged helix-turn-helix transcriptional regulator [Phenylobacterium sp.]
MAHLSTVSFETTLQVRDTCLCLHAQRAARGLARRFDEALRPAGLTNGQFSLMMALNGPEPATMGAAATLLGTDRTTLTGALKPLVRQGLAEVRVDGQDRRARRIALTPQGRTRLAAALPLWREAHAALEVDLDGADPARIRRDLQSLAARA